MAAGNKFENNALVYKIFAKGAYDEHLIHQLNWQNLNTNKTKTIVGSFHSHCSAVSRQIDKFWQSFIW